MPVQDHRYRNSSREAERIFKNVCGTTHNMLYLSRLIVEDIRIASRIAPASWGLTLDPDSITLNVGRGAVMQLNKERLLFLITGKLLDLIPQKKAKDFHYHQDYKFVPDAVEGRFAGSSIDKLDAFWSGHFDLVGRAAQARRVCFWPQSHSPGFIKFLRNKGYLVPNPDYPSQTIELAETRIDAPDVDEMDLSATEGRRVLFKHLRAERKPALVRKFKDLVFKRNGCLKCEVCEFDFSEIYGSIGFMYAEVHHIEPLHKLEFPKKVAAKDLSIVCSNCHRMLHRGNPVFLIEELRQRMGSSSKARDA